MKKQNIIFLHGILETSSELKPLLEMVQAQGHRVYSFDFSGHGKASVWPDEFRIDLFARELDAFIKKHEISHPVIFGHSTGGYVALYHKTNFEDSTIDKIFTYGTKFNWSSEINSKEKLLLDPDQVIRHFPDQANLYLNRHGERWKVLMRATAHMLQHLERLDGLSKEDLAEIKIPVFLLLGDQDKMVTQEETNALKDSLGQAKVLTISNSKNDLERSNLKEIADIITEHLD
jgi:pimeloyl-ACP methyl ester carboxylesterase